MAAAGGKHEQHQEHARAKATSRPVLRRMLRNCDRKLFTYDAMWKRLVCVKVSNRECIGCECLALGLYQHRGATMSGSHNTGDFTPCCMTRAYHGCPYPVEERGYSKELAAQRKKDGMKVI